MAQNETNNINKVLNICKANGESFYGLKLRKYSVESVVMSLGDKISGDVYYQDNALPFTMQEYVEYDGVKYYLVNPPTVVREGLVKDNSGLNGMTKYSLTFYHPMYMLSNFPFTDVAVQGGEELYLAQNKTFSWIGNLFDFIAKLNKNLETTEWVVDNCIQHWVDENEEEATEEWAKASELSEVLTFDKNFVSDALKTAYDSWNIPFTITKINLLDENNVQKNFLIQFGTPNQEILDGNNNTFVFRFGQGVGLKNNSRTPRNNKIVTRIVGEGAERNIPYGYPQIRWYGDQTWEWTEYVDNDKTKPHTATAFPIYSGILDGQWVKLIKHPFTRTTLMPSVYVQDVFNKVSPYSIRELPSGTIVPNPNYNRNGVIRDYYDATSDYPHEINPNAPSTEMHQFEDIYPRLGTEHILDAYPIDAQSKGSQVSVTQTISDMMAFIDARRTASTIQEEKDALLRLYNQLNLRNTSQVPITIAYYDNSTSGSYQFNCVVQPKGGSAVGVWVIWYTSDTFNIVAQEAIENRQQATLDWDDTYDVEKDEYIQSYFKIKLPTLNFDMYACASITENMQINMRSGACIGCTFDIMVDWDDYKRNFYDANGNFAPNGTQRNYDKYPDSSDEEVEFEVVCKKDLQTFGTLMPNKYQYPKGVDSSQAHPYAGDEFVILGISLPEEYITRAQEELDYAMMAYMLENNIYYYDYPLKFDEHFLVTHQDILAQIKNNSAIHFLYTNEEITLYVKQIVIKYGEGVLPQWDITLTDKIEVVLNKIGQAIDGVGKLRVEIENIQSNAEYDKIETSLAIRRQEQNGKTGRFYYYAGTWVGSASPDSYVVSESQAPFFEYIREITTEDEQHHEITVQVQEFWLFNPATTGSYTQEQMGEPSLTAEGWEQMVSDFKYLITEAIFAQFAHFGSAIISGDWMISQHGTINGQERQDFQHFDPEHPNDNTGTNFIPNYAIDLLTGTTYQHNAYVNGTIYASSLGMVFKDIAFTSNDETYFVGLNQSTFDAEIDGLWNFRFVPANNQSKMTVILPTNKYAFFGQRVLIYNVGVGLGGGQEIIINSAYVDSEGLTTLRNIVGLASNPQSSPNPNPFVINSFVAAKLIAFVNGFVELICVPSYDNTQLCDWAVVNIGTNFYRIDT